MPCRLPNDSIPYLLSKQVKPQGDIARAQGMAQVARVSGLSRESFFKALSGEHSPSFDTILKVVTALGQKLSASVRTEAEVT